MNRPSGTEGFRTAGEALASVAPHLPNSIHGLVGAMSISFREVVWNAAGADALADRSAPHGVRTYRDCALGALERLEEQHQALRRLLEALPDTPEAA